MCCAAAHAVRVPARHSVPDVVFVKVRTFVVRRLLTESIEEPAHRTGWCGGVAAFWTRHPVASSDVEGDPPWTDQEPGRAAGTSLDDGSGLGATLLRTVPNTQKTPA